MDSTFYENEPELGVFVFSVFIQMFANRHSFFDQAVEVLGVVRRNSVCLQDAKNLAAGDIRDLWNPKTVTKCDTYLRRSEALFRKLANVVANVLCFHFQPRRRSSAIRNG